MAETSVIWEGSLGVTYDVQQGHLIKRTYQADYAEIYGLVADERKRQKQRFLGGWKVGTVANNDLPALQQQYPELFAPGVDRELRRQALVRWSNDPRWEHARLAAA